MAEEAKKEEIKASESKQASEDSKKTNVGVSPPKRGKARVDFSKDVARMENAKEGKADLVGGCGVTLTDKKSFTLPNGMKVEN